MSLTATISMSASRSWAMRRTARPMRPKPLIATRVGMGVSFGGLGLDELVLEGVLDELGAARSAQLLLDVGPVGLDGPHGEVELAGDLGVGVAERDAAQHVALA